MSRFKSPKPLIIYFVTILLWNKVLAQYPPNATRYNEAYGSAKALTGKVKVIDIFVSDDKKGWSDEDKKMALAKQEYGHRWVQTQARQYNPESNLEFNVSVIGEAHDIKVKEIYASRTPGGINLIPWILPAIGYTSARHFYDSLMTADSSDNVFVMIFAKKIGRAFSQPLWYKVSKNSERFLEATIVYTEGYGDEILNVGTIVHEMLHLFGAWDIYSDKTSGQTSVVQKNAVAVFGNSVMIDNNKTITELNIDKLTAWTVGLTNTYLGWFDFFRPRADPNAPRIGEMH